MADQDPKNEKSTEENKREESSQPVNGAGASQSSDPFGGSIDEEFEAAQKEIQAAMSEMRREFARANVEEAKSKARSWVERHPVLAVSMAVGVGIVIGRAVSVALQPDPWPVRTRKKGQQLATRAQKIAREAGASAADRASRTRKELAKETAEARRRVGTSAEKALSGARKAGTQASHLGERVAHLAEDTYGTLTQRASQAAHSVQERADEVAEAAHEAAEQGSKWASALFTTVRTLLIAVVVRKLTRFFRP